MHTPYLLYNVADIKWLGTEGERHQGWGAGAGISYGYSWLLSRHWNLEATVGVGYLYLKSDKYPCANCGRKQEGIQEALLRAYAGGRSISFTNFKSMED